MLTGLWAKIDGYKSYILGVATILIALIGHFWGPITAGPIDVPTMSWSDTWALIWKGALIISGKSAIEKLSTK